MSIVHVLALTTAACLAAGFAIAYRWVKPSAGEPWSGSDIKALGLSSAFVATLLSLIALAAVGFVFGAAFR